MAIKLAKKRTIVWPVTVNVPTDGGRTKAETFDVEFKVLSQPELNAIAESGKDLLDEVVVGWPKGPRADDAEGEEGVPFSDAAKRELLETTYARAALYAAYSEVQVGRAAARKN